MHIHWKRTILTFSLAGLGVLALAVRPALQSNEMNLATGESSSVTHKLMSDLQVKPFSINAKWYLTDSPEYASYRLKTGEQNPFDYLKSAYLNISVMQNDQDMVLEVSKGELETLSVWDKAEIEYYSFTAGWSYKEMSDGYNYACYNQHVVVKLTLQRSFFEDSLEGYMLIPLMVDPLKETIDTYPFHYFNARKEYTHIPAGSPEGSLHAPSRYGLDATEKTLQQTAETIIEVNYASQARSVAQRLAPKLAQLVKLRPHPERVWPASWGQYKSIVADLHEEVNRATILSKELNYFDSPEWKEFVESYDFYLVFGEHVTTSDESSNY